MLSNDRLNRSYMVLLYGALGFGGSLYSVLVTSAVIFSALKLVAGRLRDEPAPEIVTMAVAGLAYYASGLLIIVTNPGDAGNYPLAVERLLFIGFLPLYLQIALLNKEQLRESLEIGAAIGAAGVATWALIQWSLRPYETYYFRASGAPGNPGPFATTCALLLTVCLMAAVRSAKTRRRAIFLVASVLAALALMLTGMRTLYPALLLLPLLIIFLSGDAKTLLRRRGAVWTIGTMILVLMPVGGLVLYWRLSQLFQMIDLSGFAPSATNSLGQRIALLTCAYEGFLESPLFGMGRADAYEFMAACSRNLVGETLQFSHFHNALATAAAFGGLVEISAMLAMLLVPLYWCWHHRQDPARRYGVVLILSILTVYGLNGTSNLMLGHDIHDALFVHLMAVGFVLLAGETATARRRQAA
ncbi:O-antigen ligase family protein [Oceaniradius stylonematis]|uniref:O-antigen ligase family protein n=1 Tax=Oceaniradius stylonematis TaxID=2184161 RepID=UPI00273D2E8C|nr:O-antigen ligase family protein [Oceaniradius stylonematis]